MAKSYELLILFHTKGHMMTISIFMDDLCCKCSIFMNSLQPLHLGYCQDLNICAGHHHHPHYLNTNIISISTSQHHHLHRDHPLYHGPATHSFFMNPKTVHLTRSIGIDHHFKIYYQPTPGRGDVYLSEISDSQFARNSQL